MKNASHYRVQSFLTLVKVFNIDVHKEQSEYFVYAIPAI